MQFGDFFWDGDKRCTYEAPPGFSYILDGDGYRIYTPDDPQSAPLQSSYDLRKDLWSKYVDYMDAIEWALPVFERSGGALRPSGENATADFLLINEWTIVPANYKHAMIVNGNLTTSTGHPIIDIFDVSRVTEQVVPFVQGSDSLITYDVSSTGVINETDIHTALDNYNNKDSYKADVSYLRKSIYVNTELEHNGDGSQGNPYNNVNDAKEHAESKGIDNIYVSGDVTVPGNLKNMTIIGVGLPRIDLNGRDIKNTSFYRCSLSGEYSNEIIAEDCHIEDNFLLRGHFLRCELTGNTITAPDGEVLLVDCISSVHGIDGKTSLSMNEGRSSSVIITGFKGTLNVTDCDDKSDIISVEMCSGTLVFGANCSDGKMVAGGVCSFVDNTDGANVVDQTINRIYMDNIPANVWSYVTRELTVSVGLTPAQEDKLFSLINVDGKIDILTAKVDFLPDSILNKVI